MQQAVRARLVRYGRARVQQELSQSRQGRRSSAIDADLREVADGPLSSPPRFAPSSRPTGPSRCSSISRSACWASIHHTTSRRSRRRAASQRSVADSRSEDTSSYSAPMLKCYRFETPHYACAYIPRLAVLTSQATTSSSRTSSPAPSAPRPSSTVTRRTWCATLFSRSLMTTD